MLSCSIEIYSYIRYISVYSIHSLSKTTYRKRGFFSLIYAYILYIYI